MSSSFLGLWHLLQILFVSLWTFIGVIYYEWKWLINHPTEKQAEALLWGEKKKKRNIMTKRRESPKDHSVIFVWKVGRREDSVLYAYRHIDVLKFRSVSEWVQRFKCLCLFSNFSSFWQLCTNMLSAGTPPAEPILTCYVCELLNIQGGEKGEKHSWTDTLKKTKKTLCRCLH